MIEPVFIAMSRTSAPPGRLRKARWLGFLLTMLGFNAYPLSDLAGRGQGRATVVAAVAALTVLAVLWVRAMWLALATTVPFRTRAPWTAGVVVVGAGLALVMGGQFSGLLIYVSIACAVSLPIRWVLPALAGATAVAAVVDVFRLGRPGAHPPGANAIFGNLSFVFFLGLMMLFYRRVMLLISELRRAREDLARLAVTEERLRFARDLHDLLGHSLSSIALKCQLARRLAADDTVGAEIADIEAVARKALVDIRAAVTGYRQTSLAEELDAARGVLTAAGIRLSADLPAAPLPVQADAMLGWVVREAATNVVRHSRARRCRIRVTRTGDAALLVVGDDGIGPPPAAVTGNGLVGLAERLTAVGGTLETGPAPERGFRLTARLPLATDDRTPVATADGPGLRNAAGAGAPAVDRPHPRPDGFSRDAEAVGLRGLEGVSRRNDDHSDARPGDADDAGPPNADGAGSPDPEGVGSRGPEDVAGRKTGREDARTLDGADDAGPGGTGGAGTRPVVESEPA